MRKILVKETLLYHLRPHHGTTAGRNEVAPGERGSYGGSGQSSLQALLAGQPAEHPIGSSRSSVPINQSINQSMILMV